MLPNDPAPLTPTQAALATDYELELALQDNPGDYMALAELEERRYIARDW